MITLRYFLAALAVFFVSLPGLCARPHKTAITISPFHLTQPIVEVTGEFAMTRDIGMAAIVGIGSYDGASFFEIGGQYNYYIIGNFNHGMQLGAELLYAHLSDGFRLGDDKVNWAGQGLAVSPFLGYKFAANYGLTLNIQGGVSLVVARASVESSYDGTTDSASNSTVGPLLNINVGWSF